MVGGTKVPPRDSQSEPWSHEPTTKARSTATATPKAPTKGKSKPEGARPKDGSIARASLEVSLDNADTVIEGAPLLAAFCKGRVNRGASTRPLAKKPQGAGHPKPDFHLLKSETSEKFVSDTQELQIPRFA